MTRYGLETLGVGVLVIWFPLWLVPVLEPPLLVSVGVAVGLPLLVSVGVGDVVGEGDPVVVGDVVGEPVVVGDVVGDGDPVVGVGVGVGDVVGDAVVGLGVGEADGVGAAQAGVRDGDGDGSRLGSSGSAFLPVPGPAPVSDALLPEADDLLFVPVRPARAGVQLADALGRAVAPAPDVVVAVERPVEVYTLPGGL